MTSGRRFLLYFAWNRQVETKAALNVLENRFPTLYEVRRGIWPQLEALRDPAHFDQGIGGVLDLLVLPGFELCKQVLLAETGEKVRAVDRVTDAGVKTTLGDPALGEVDTLIIQSFDHLGTSQEPSPAEVRWVREFLASPRHCLVVCPHHDVGALESPAAQVAEYEHHADTLVPAQQRLGGFARALLRELGFPVENRYGLRAGRTSRDSLAPLLINRDLDTRGVLTGVTTFNGHAHLPHLFVPPAIADRVDVLAQQEADTTTGAGSRRNHPFFESGQVAFNAFLQLRGPDLAGSLFVGDATLWTSAFGGVDSLTALWRNLAHLSPGNGKDYGRPRRRRD